MATQVPLVAVTNTLEATVGIMTRRDPIRGTSGAKDALDQRKSKWTYQPSADVAVNSREKRFRVHVIDREDETNVSGISQRDYEFVPSPKKLE